MRDCSVILKDNLFVATVLMLELLLIYWYLFFIQFKLI